MWYLVVFQPSKCEMLMFSLKFDQFDSFSQMTQEVCYLNKKKIRKSESGGGSASPSTKKNRQAVFPLFPKGGIHIFPFANLSPNSNKRIKIKKITFFKFPPCSELTVHLAAPAPNHRLSRSASAHLQRR